MQSVYLVAGIVGVCLIVVSLLGGAHDSDGDGHIDSLEAHGQDGQEGHWLPFFSLRFYTYFCASFGVTGLILSNFLKVGEPVGMIISLVTGLLVGLTVSYTIRLFRRHETSSGVASGDLVGKQGTVLVAVRPQGLGRIRLTVKGDIFDMIALGDDGATLEAGSTAVIVGVEGDRVRIASLDSLGLTHPPAQTIHLSQP